MKKRGFLCIAALFTVLLLVGCDSKPSDMSDTAYRAGNKAVEIAESYLNMDISQKEAYDQLDEVYDRLGDSEDESISDLSVRIEINTLQIHLLSISELARDVDEKVEKDLGELRSLLKYGRIK